MKKLVLLLLATLPLSVFAQRMGIVDDLVIREMPQFAEVKTQIAQISDKYKAEYEKLQGDIDKKVTEYQALNLQPNTPENIRLLRIQEIQELNSRIQEFRNAATIDIKNHEEELLKPLEQQLDAAIAAVGEEGGYTVIYRKSAVAYTSPQVVDVTELVKDKLTPKPVTEEETETVTEEITVE